MRARYPLALALVVLLALVPPAVTSEAARAPTAQAGQLWLLVLEPTAAFAPGADEPAWVAEPGEWYWVVNRNAARDRTGTSLWALAVWEFDPPSAAVLIRLDERVQQFLEPTPPPPPTPAPAGAAAVVESRIDGEFTGWDGETVFALANGQFWQQTSYAYTYHYAYRPRVLIYPSSEGYSLQVEGVSSTIAVRDITGSVVDSQISGEFTGWRGDTIFLLTNGQVCQQAQYAYWY